jgi:hypothetical protein
LFVRLVAPQSRALVANWMAVGCGLPLIATAFVSSWPLALGCWLASGALAAYEVEVLSAIVFAAPNAIRTQFVGVASALLLGAQGLGVLASGAVVKVTTAAHAVGLAGLTGSALALILVLGPLRAAPTARHNARDAGPRAPATEPHHKTVAPYAARHR